MSSKYFTGCALAFALFGCASDGADDALNIEDSNLTSIEPGSFKLYPLSVVPNPSCDVHTFLELAKGGKSKAVLRETVGGDGPGPTCKLAVVPNERTFSLTSKAGGCGTRIYSGSRKVGARRYKVTITDNRKRTCTNAIEGLVVVDEELPGNGLVHKVANGDLVSPGRVGQSCGPMSGIDCAAGLYCNYPTSASASCGALNQMGKCEERGSGICPMNFAPVCGCDRKTYSNACVAKSAGVSVAKTGPCN